MRSEQETNRAIDRYADMVKRLCVVHRLGHADAEDVFQNVFLKYLLSPVVFADDEHEKAWLIRVTINECKDLFKRFIRHQTLPLEAIGEQEAAAPQDCEVLGAVLALPEKFRDVVYLHFYEGYTAPEMAEILHKNVNTIYTWMTRAKAMLKERLGGELHG